MFFNVATRRLIPAIALALLSVNAAASVHTLDRNNSSVSITFTQLGQTLQARFNRFDAAIRFDEQHIGQAHAYIDLDITSFDMGDAAYNHEVLTPNWFHAAQFPVSTFASTAFIPTGIPADGIHYDVTGKLIIKGTSADVRFPLTVTKDHHQYTFVGTVPIQRLTYNIGEDVWHGTRMVANDVTITFHLVTTSPDATATQ